MLAVLERRSRRRGADHRPDGSLRRAGAGLAAPPQRAECGGRRTGYRRGAPDPADGRSTPTAEILTALARGAVPDGRSSAPPRRTGGRLGRAPAYSTQPRAILTLAARVRGLQADDYRRLDADRSAVRLPAMRGSGFLVPTGTAAAIFGATRRPVDAMAWIWREIGLSDAEYARAKAAVMQVAGTPFSVTELRRRLTGDAANLLARHPQAPTMVVRAMRSEGSLVAIAPLGLRSNVYAYVATDAWLGAPLEPVDPDRALAWLAGEYLRSFGPVRLADFRWWAGTTPNRAQAAMAGQPTVELEGGLLLPSADRDAFEATEPLDPDAVDLLPLWDGWTMGYAPDGRDRFVRPEHLDRAYTGGDGRGLVLRAGRAVAAWGLRFAARRMEVRLDLFETPTAGLRQAIDDGLRETAALLDATDVITFEGPMRGRTGWGWGPPGTMAGFRAGDLGAASFAIRRSAPDESPTVRRPGSRSPGDRRLRRRPRSTPALPAR